MSGLFATLNSTVKAITAHSRAIETTGKNLANVNNTGYARQRVVYGDRGTVVTPQGAQSIGLEAVGIQQMRDSLLDRQVSREIALKASYEAEQSGYQRAQAGLGQSIDRSSATTTSDSTGKNGLAAAIDDFFNAFQSFAAQPTDAGERQTLVQRSQILTDRFRLADQRIGQVQTDLNAEIGTDVDTVNTLLKTIADLNTQIGRFEVNAPGSAVDLRDQRQARLEDLAAKISIDVHDAGDGQLQVVAKNSDGSEVELVNRATVHDIAAFDPTGTTLSVGTPAVSLDIRDLTGGSIKGSLTAREGAVKSLRTELDALANQLVTSVNGVYNDAAAPGNFFDPTGTTAGSIKLLSSITAASLKSGPTSAAGDNSIALGIAQLATTTFSTAPVVTPPVVAGAIDGTFSEYFSKSVSNIGQALAGANSRVDDQTNIERLVRAQRESVSGVSLDEEMADLMKYQRAFQASSRVFSVVDDLLELVVTRLGN